VNDTSLLHGVKKMQILCRAVSRKERGKTQEFVGGGPC